MYTIEKIPNGYYDRCNIEITCDNKVLRLSQGGSDPSISCLYKDYHHITDISFEISKEETKLYSEFDKLYTNIVAGNILGEDETKDSVKERLETQRKTTLHNRIVKDGIITIYSDGYPDEYPNILRVKKDDEKIILEFEKIEGKHPKPHYAINILIRLEGSPTQEYSIPFYHLYLRLQNIEETKRETEDKKRTRLLM